MAVVLAHQIQEIDRELAMRAAVYPRWVHAGKMRQGEADLHIERMRAVKVTLEWLQTNEIEIREHIASKKEEVNVVTIDSVRTTAGAAED